ncbi:MAG: hypothetical protein GWN29_11365 [Gammaproteobacteria bacterium]|nr:hypothetical protein [Gammaproteobacteria bacterium]
MLKVTFISGILFGLAAVVSGAGLYPWIDHERLESQTQVVPNGGRSEVFFIRLPVDRIASLGTAGFGPGAAAFPAALALPDSLDDAQPMQIDHFKVRDIGGNVIGVASRHTVDLTDSAAVTWSLSFPSRGALWLVSQFDPAALDAALAAVGYQPGEAWEGELDLFVGDPQSLTGDIHGGTSEFSTLTGTFTERWQITGVGDSGELRGTIELDTTTYLTQ